MLNIDRKTVQKLKKIVNLSKEGKLTPQTLSQELFGQSFSSFGDIVAEMLPTSIKSDGPAFTKIKETFAHFQGQPATIDKVVDSLETVSNSLPTTSQTRKDLESWLDNISLLNFYL